MTYHRIVFYLSLFLLCFLPANSLLAKKKVPGVTDTEVVLGTSVPLSGPAAMWGNLSKAMEAYATYINEQGGIHGRKIKLIIKDDGYNPSRAVANVKEMAEDVFAVVGLLGTAVVSATRDILLEKGIPLIYPLGNPRMWVGYPWEKLQYAFVVYPDYVSEGSYLSKFAYEELKIRSLSIVYQNDDYGQSGLQGVKDYLRENTSVVLKGEIPVERGAGELSGEAQKLKEAGAEGVILYLNPTHAGKILQEMGKIGYLPKILASFTLADPIMFRLAGPAWEGVYLGSGFLLPGMSPEADQIFEIVVKYNPELKNFPYFAIAGATSLLLAVEGLKRAGKDLTREKFLSALEEISDLRIGGGVPITFSKKRRHGANSLFLFQAKGGKYELIKGRVDFPPLF
jgi:ABC-type branched-subunit amino acid transport system substrate-binding protein